MFIPRLEEYSYPRDGDNLHFLECKIRLQGKLKECKLCKYVWDHWYGTDTPFDFSAEETK
jgi:hypothetical protein